MGSYRIYRSTGGKGYMIRHISQPWTDCHSRTAQVEGQGQTRCTRILYCNPFIDTSYGIGYRLELKYFHTGLYMAFEHSILFATNLAANFGCYQFRIISEIVSKLLRTAIWSQFESELRCTSCLFRSAALHRIWLGRYGFVPMPFF